MVLSKTDSAVVAGTTTSEDGSFNIVSDGKDHLLMVSMIGYILGNRRRNRSEEQNAIGCDKNCLAYEAMERKGYFPDISYICLTAAMTRILFICHGNICRSPMAEFILKALVKAKDSSNLRWLRRIIPDDPGKKIHLMMSYTGSARDVADPWYTLRLTDCPPLIFK